MEKDKSPDTAADQGAALLRKISGTEIERAAKASGGDLSKFAPLADTTACVNMLRKADEGRKLRRFFQSYDTVMHSLVQDRDSYEKAFVSGSPGPKGAFVGSCIALMMAAMTALSYCAEAVPGQANALRLRPEGVHAALDTRAVKTLDQLAEKMKGRKFSAGIREEALEQADPTILEFWGSLEEVTLVGVGATAAVAVAAVFTVAGALGWLRDLAEEYMQTRMKLADWIDAQAALIQLNASRLSSGQGKARTAQLEWANKFNRVAARVRADLAVAERQAMPASQRKLADRSLPGAVSLA